MWSNPGSVDGRSPRYVQHDNLYGRLSVFRRCWLFWSVRAQLSPVRDYAANISIDKFPQTPLLTRSTKIQHDKTNGWKEIAFLRSRHSCRYPRLNLSLFDDSQQHAIVSSLYRKSLSDVLRIVSNLSGSFSLQKIYPQITHRFSIWPHEVRRLQL